MVSQDGGRGSDSLETLVSIKGDVLPVKRPGDVLCLQEIHDSGDASEALGCGVHFGGML
jgi:formylmethanofuran dehydrogenase subunit C